jgi:hypothetical protein
MAHAKLRRVRKCAGKGIRWQHRLWISTRLPLQDSPECDFANTQHSRMCGSGVDMNTQHTQRVPRVGERLRAAPRLARYAESENSRGFWASIAPSATPVAWTRKAAETSMRSASTTEQLYSPYDIAEDRGTISESPTSPFKTFPCWRHWY